MKLKTSLDAVLTTLTAGCPIAKTSSDREIEKLRDKNRVLNSHLPYVEVQGASKEEAFRLNVMAKSEAIYEKLPALKDIEDDVNIIKDRLMSLLMRDGKITDDYLVYSNALLTLASKRVKTSEIVFEFDENEK